MRCERCFKETKTWKMSRFCTEQICMECEEKEKQHPLYKEAVRTELEAVKNGDYNFEGIGKPADL